MSTKGCPCSHCRLEDALKEVRRLEDEVIKLKSDLDYIFKTLDKHQIFLNF